MGAASFLATGAGAAADEAVEEEELHDVTVLMPKHALHAHVKLKKPPTKIERLHSAIELSILETQQFLKGKFFNRIVSDWWVSPEAGLAHRELDPSRADFEAKN
jgi:hypothetical protein